MHISYIHAQPASIHPAPGSPGWWCACLRGATPAPWLPVYANPLACPQSIAVGSLLLGPSVAVCEQDRCFGNKTPSVFSHPTPLLSPQHTANAPYNLSNGAADKLRGSARLMFSARILHPRSLKCLFTYLQGWWCCPSLWRRPHRGAYCSPQGVRRGLFACGIPQVGHASQTARVVLRIKHIWAQSPSWSPLQLGCWPRRRTASCCSLRHRQGFC